MDKEDKELQIDKWIKFLGTEMARANDLQRDVEERLTPLLRNVEPDKTEPEPEAEPAQELVPLANEIRGAVWHITKISDSYVDILSRLEI